MICDQCGKEREGDYLEVVTGKQLSSHTSREGTRTSTETSYGEFQKLLLCFCQDCWREQRRKSDGGRLKSWAIWFGVTLVVAIVGSAASPACGGFVILFSLVCLVQTIKYAIKRYRTNYSELDMDLATPKSLFDDFKDFLPALVYKARGQVYFWEAQNWQDWTDKKPGVRPDIFHSEA